MKEDAWQALFRAAGSRFFWGGCTIKPHDCTTTLMEVAQIVPKEAEDRGQGSDDCGSICRLGGLLGSTVDSKNLA